MLYLYIELPRYLCINNKKIIKEEEDALTTDDPHPINPISIIHIFKPYY